MKGNVPCMAALLAATLALPAVAETPRFGFGLGVASGSIDNGTYPDNCHDYFCTPETDEFSGFSLFGRVGLTRHWGLLLSYRDLEESGGLREDEIFGRDDSYSNLGLFATYTWRPQKKIRPHLKFGLARIDYEASGFGFEDSDDDVTVSLGGGVEIGPQKFAFFADLDVTEINLDMESFEDDRLSIGDLTLGIIFRL